MFSYRLLTNKHIFNLRRYTSSFKEKQDVVIIGAGPGGYVAAIKAGQKGMKVTCIENRKSLGGTCLNIGCIPSKALLNTSHMFWTAKNKFESYGIENGTNIKMNIPKMQSSKNNNVKMLTSGIAMLFRKNKVNHIHGKAKIINPNEVRVDGQKDTIKTKNIIIASGSINASLPGITIDEKNILSSTGALELQSIPKKLTVIGAGVIGIELGSVWSKLGSKVTIIEYLDRILPGVDLEIAKDFQRILKSQGINFKLNRRVKAVEESKGLMKVKVETKDKKLEEEKSDKVLIAIGRKAYTEGLGLTELGINMNKGIINVDNNLQTNIPNIFAIGDVIKGPQLAHKAEEEGIAVIEHLSGEGGHVNYDNIAGVIYTHPEVAYVGKTEDMLKAEKIQYKKGKFPFLANSRAKAVGDNEGYIKILTDTYGEKILGIHMIGAEAGELIHEGVLAMEYGASAEDIARTCHAHPTRSEAMKEAALACYNKPIHF